MHNYGIISLIPPLIVVLIAIRTKLSLEPLIIGCLVGYIIIAKGNFFNAIIGSFTKVMQNELMVWVMMVCSLYGALINLMIRSGGVLAFGNYMLKYATTKRKSLFTTWVFGSFLFVDDYLNALTSGTTMKKITDHYKVSREMLAFVVSSTAVPICVIVPISTWVIFIGKLLEDSKLVPAGKGIASYLHIIPYISYGWIQYLLVPLVIFGIMPIIGKMKKANFRAETTGQLIPDNSKEFKMDVEVFDEKKKGNIWYLILPIAVLISATILFDLDALKGVIVALIFTIAFYAYKKVALFKELSTSSIEGMKSMLFALVLLLLSYLLKNLGDDMGLTQYIIDVVSPNVSAQLLPLAIFISLGLVAFTTGNSWGLYAIAIPLVIPLAAALHCNVWLCIGAVVSAGAFGAHACFYSDATILAAQGAECNNYEHGITQLPFALVSFTLSCLAYVAMGYLVH
jgi:tetracycline resistance efflux pump